MRIPEDWDTASSDNASLCAKFTFGEHVYGGRDLPYRLFTPKKTGDSKRYPLVLYLHGADAVGQDNRKQLDMHDIGTCLAKDEWQRENPCYILAPQYRKHMHWAGPGMAQHLMSLIEEILSMNTDIDESRVYMYGYSAGGIGALEFIKQYPNSFAGAIIICGATIGKGMDKLTYTPMWLFHAEDDTIVPCGDRSFIPIEGTYLGSRPIFRLLEPRMGEHVRYTEYPRGWMKNTFGINPHCTWVPVGVNKVCWKWLFSQQN